MKKQTTLAAVALAALTTPAFAIDILLPNGSFETGQPASNTFGLINNWVVQSVPTSGFQSGVFTSYASFTPQHGSRMALVTNGGLTPASTPLFVQMTNATPIELLNMPFFNFWFAFLTTDPTSTALANRDSFRVVIDYFNDAAGLTQIGTESFVIDTGSLASTGVNPGVPFGAVVNAGTGPTSPKAAGGLGFYVIPISLTSAPYANFTFYLDNLGTAGGTSGVLIDNVYINPEPGTLALFGLGALGLGGFVWRRRSAKKAAEAAAQ